MSIREFLKDYVALCKRHGIFIDGDDYHSLELVLLGGPDGIDNRDWFERTLRDILRGEITPEERESKGSREWIEDVIEEINNE